MFLIRTCEGCWVRRGGVKPECDSGTWRKQTKVTREGMYVKRSSPDIERWAEDRAGVKSSTVYAGSHVAGSSQVPASITVKNRSAPEPALLQTDTDIHGGSEVRKAIEALRNVAEKNDTARARAVSTLVRATGNARAIRVNERRRNNGGR